MKFRRNLEKQRAREKFLMGGTWMCKGQLRQSFFFPFFFLSFFSFFAHSLSKRNASRPLFLSLFLSLLLRAPSTPSLFLPSRSQSRPDNKFKLIKADSSWKLPHYEGGRSTRWMKSQHRNNFILIKRRLDGEGCIEQRRGSLNNT